jgi:hypothetical protein
MQGGEIGIQFLERKMKAKGILTVVVACFVLGGAATLAWGLCKASVQLGPVDDYDLPEASGQYEPCEDWLIWDFEFWFWEAPGWTGIATYTTSTDFYRYYDSDEQENGWNHFEGYDWDNHDTHETVIDIAMGSSCGHFSDMELYVQYSASAPD